ncbi:hypothetical protein LOK74_00745 [Brevibacillus humidisoli]|uniref:hypothetical protein n=1 Tax=Brevibacillus humidisoli TaxID=2895522 RepID=UPI001E2B00E1|nr:hypothetical protein [Brevibacillus humidisoli]UFJ41123.1 hypothetical protein LOK74_00745 [Brevibacillus humidisoli]
MACDQDSLVHFNSRLFFSVLSLSVSPLLTSLFSHGTFASNMARELEYETGALVVIGVSFLIGIAALLASWPDGKSRRTRWAYLGLIVFAVVPLLVLSFPITYMVSQEVRRETADVRQFVSSLRAEQSGLLDWSAIREVRYNPDAERIEISLDYDTEKILDFYGKAKETNLVFHRVKQFLAGDIRNLHHQIWDEIAVQQEVVIDAYWDEQRVHVSRTTESTDLDSDSDYYSFDLQKKETQLILRYYVEGTWNERVIEEE